MESLQGYKDGRSSLGDWLERHPLARSVFDLLIRLQRPVYSMLAIILSVYTIFTAEPISPVSLLVPFYFLGLLAKIPKSAALSLPEFIRQESSNTKLILFLHGWNGDRQGTWREFPHLVLQDARFNHCDVLSLGYPTFMARRNLKISELVSFLIDRLSAGSTFDKYDAIVVVAHSMGGLVAREMVLQSRLADNTVKIQAIVAIATPHNGANRAALMKALGLSRTLTGSLVQGSEFLRTLAVHWNRLANSPETHGIGSPHDRVVSISSAHHLCVRIHHYPQWNHREVVKPVSLEDERYKIPMSLVDGFTKIAPRAA